MVVDLIETNSCSHLTLLLSFFVWMIFPLLTLLSKNDLPCFQSALNNALLIKMCSSLLPCFKLCWQRPFHLLNPPMGKIVLTARWTCSRVHSEHWTSFDLLCNYIIFFLSLPDRCNRPCVSSNTIPTSIW